MNRITVAGLARQLGCDRHHLGRVLNADQPASADLRAKVAAYLDLPEEQLFRPTEPKMPYPGDLALAKAAQERAARLQAQSWPT
jgi:transcriptional regulator with XRE-family HTH domain